LIVGFNIIFSISAAIGYAPIEKLGLPIRRYWIW